MKVALKLGEQGIIVEARQVFSDKVPKGFHIVTENDFVPYKANAIPAYRWDGKKISGRSRKDIFKDKLRNIKSGKDIINLDHNDIDKLKENLINEFINKVNKLSETVVLIILIAFCVGFGTTLLVFVVDFLSITFWIFLSGVILSGIVIAARFRNMIRFRKIGIRVPAVIVTENNTGNVPLPLVLRNKPHGFLETGNRPFIISIKNIYQQCYNYYCRPEISLKKPADPANNAQNPGSLAVFLSILKGIDYNNQFGNFYSGETIFNTGPFTNARKFQELLYYLKPVCKSCRHNGDLKLLNEIMPEFQTIMLPAGMNLIFNLTGKKRNIVLYTHGLKLKIAYSFGYSFPLESSPWRRRFNIDKGKASVNNLVFSVNFDFGNLSLKLFRDNNCKNYWPPREYLLWSLKLIAWLKEYLVWIEDESNIPEDEVFELIESVPVRYKYKLGLFHLELGVE